LKLSPILAQYLYNNKALHLAGIGKFLIDPSVTIDPELSRSQKTAAPLNIKFEQDSSYEEDPSLIAYISQETGKMKSLAAADLDSHLELARQFLNIGKPFQFEGIGTLVKNKLGNFEFMPGHPINEKMKDIYAATADPTSTNEESFTQYDDMFSPKKAAPPSLRKIAVILAAIAGLALAVWGGYTIYKKGASLKKNQQASTVSNPIPADTTAKQRDSIPVNSNRDPGTYRFVLEQSGKTRAFNRFQLLRGLGVKVKLETADSVLYKIVLTMPATAADTLRIRDSLSILYVNPRYMKNGKALVE
jgi:hypothetical protein